MDKKRGGKKYIVVYISIVMARKKELKLFVSFYIMRKDHAG